MNRLIQNVMPLAFGASLALFFVWLGQHWADPPSEQTGYTVTDYLQVRRIAMVSDEYGIAVEVDRSILQEFSSVWTAKLYAVDGTFYCGGSGGSVYTPDAKLPERIDLFAWWLGKPGPEACVVWPLPAKCYELVTRWVVQETGQGVTYRTAPLCT